MPYVISLRDAPGSAEPRRALLPAHLEYVERAIDRILVAGPLRDAGGSIVGSLYVLDVPDEAAARAFLAADPYHAGGVWADAAIASFAAAAGAWVGGLAWQRR